MLRILLLATTLALPAAAEDVALVLAVSDYARLPDLPGAERTIPAADGLVARGFQIVADTDPNAAARADLIERFTAGLREADRAVVVMAGRFVTDGTRTWWLGPEAREVTLFGIGPEAVSVETMMRVLATRPGGAVLLLAADDRPGAPVDPWLTEGIGALRPPTGVTVLRARPEVIASFLAARLPQPGLDLPDAVAATPGMSGYGHLPDGFAFLPAPAAPTPTTPTPTTPDAPVADSAEQAAWDVATGLDTVEGYRAYLTRYPRGLHAADARAALDSILNEPNREARLVEEALALGRDQRRDVQRHLTVLGYDTRGIDGIFGSGTRTAITNWQQQAGLSQTGYLTGDQLARLAAQAARRQAQIDAEAEAERLAAEAADRAWWAETGARGDEASLRAYLARYPEGLNARTARDRLAAIEAARAAAQGDAERLGWDQALRANTVAAYVDYLRAFPNGSHAAEARVRRDALLTGAVVAPRPVPPAPESAPAANPAAAAAEEALGLNAFTRRLVEQRLDMLRLRPGTVDGRFDADTRAAIGRYQVERGLSATGYLDQGTSLRLLADSLDALQ